MLGLRVVHRVHGDGLGIMVDRVVDVAAERRLNAAARTAAGEVIDDQLVGNVENELISDHARDSSKRKETCMAVHHKHHNGFEIYVTVDECPTQWRVLVTVTENATGRPFPKAQGQRQLAKDQSEQDVANSIIAEVCKSLDRLNGAS